METIFSPTLITKFDTVGFHLIYFFFKSHTYPETKFLIPLKHPPPKKLEYCIKLLSGLDGCGLWLIIHLLKNIVWRECHENFHAIEFIFNVIYYSILYMTITVLALQLTMYFFKQPQTNFSK